MGIGSLPNMLFTPFVRPAENALSRALTIDNFSSTSNPTAAAVTGNVAGLSQSSTQTLNQLSSSLGSLAAEYRLNGGAGGSIPAGASDRYAFLEQTSSRLAGLLNSGESFTLAGVGSQLGTRFSADGTPTGLAIDPANLQAAQNSAAAGAQGISAYNQLTTSLQSTIAGANGLNSTTATTTGLVSPSPVITTDAETQTGLQTTSIFNPRALQPASDVVNPFEVADTLPQVPTPQTAQPTAVTPANVLATTRAGFGLDFSEAFRANVAALVTEPQAAAAPRPGNAFNVDALTLARQVDGRVAQLGGEAATAAAQGQAGESRLRAFADAFGLPTAMPAGTATERQGSMGGYMGTLSGGQGQQPTTSGGGESAFADRRRQQQARELDTTRRLSLVG